jgi:hypothetical protein
LNIITAYMAPNQGILLQFYEANACNVLRLFSGTDAARSLSAL